MAIERTQHTRMVESCSLVWTGDREPLDFIRDFLRSNGVRVVRIDKARRLVFGRIGSRFNFDSCKVKAQIFPQADVCLVVMSCTVSQKTDAGTMEGDLQRLKRNLDDVRLVDEHGFLDWQKRTAPVQRAVSRDAGSIAI